MIHAQHQLIGRRVATRPGFTLVEVLVALTIIGILISLSLPSYQRALERSRADVAGANLQAIWSAERLYWLEYGAYTSDLTLLKTLGLLDPTIANSSNTYTYSAQSPDGTTFTATADRRAGGQWTGAFSVDTTGTITGVVQAAGQPDITPGFQ